MKSTDDGTALAFGSPKSVGFLGDVHGDWAAVIVAAQQAADRGATALVQVGDLGWSRKLVERARNVPACLPVYAIDGNHEDFGWLATETGARCKVVAPGLTFVARGAVRTIGGLRIGFLGGAESVDKAWRHTRFNAPEGTSGEYLWWPDERLVESSVGDLLVNAIGGIDLLVTHSPPDAIIRKHFPAEGLRMFGLDPATWTDPSAMLVESAWRALGRGPLICGHMHRAVQDGHVTILDIAQLLVLEHSASHGERSSENTHPVSSSDPKAGQS